MPSKCTDCEGYKQQIRQLRKKVEELTTAVGAVAPIQTLMAQLQQQVVSMQSQLISAIPEMINKAIEKSFELKSKKKNVVLVGCPEEGHDEDVMAKLCTLSDVASDEIVCHFRDGRPRQDLKDKGKQKRIMKIRCKNPAAPRKLLDSSKRLREAEGFPAAAYIRPDLTYEQRQLDRKAKDRYYSYDPMQRREMFMKDGKAFMRHDKSKVTVNGYEVTIQEFH